MATSKAEGTLFRMLVVERILREGACDRAGGVAVGVDAAGVVERF